MHSNGKQALENFDNEIGKQNIRGQWKYDEMLVRSIGGPQPAGIPYLWKWSSVYPLLVEACDVIPESYTARRHLGFTNPGLEKGGATHTILAGLQMVKPGEIAWAHRHTLNALRFVVQGSAEAYTVVEGEVCRMENYDLILTPQWTWHDHHNESQAPVIWLDVLDVPLMAMLNGIFYQPYAGDRQQTRKPSPSDYVQERTGFLRPTWEKPQRQQLPMRYPWSETQEQLRKMSQQQGSPYDGLALEYVNPITGGPAMPTLSCWIQMLRPGEATKPHRHISSAVYFVVRGQGETLVGEKDSEVTLRWEQHDSFVVPNWSWHQFRNLSKTEDAILFTVNDSPVFEALGMYREEPENTLHTASAPVAPAPMQRVNAA